MPATEPAFMPRPKLVTPDLAAFATMDDVEFKERFGETPLARAKRAGLQRNAAAMLHNASAADSEARNLSGDQRPHAIIQRDDR